MNYDMKKSGERICQLRIQQGFTQENIAQMLNIDRSFYSRIEAGKNGCAVDLFIQLSGLFEVSLDYLILGKYDSSLLRNAEGILLKEKIEETIAHLEQIIKERLAEMALPWTIFTLGRNAVHTTRQFKAELGSVLLATGAAWEGFDFPGDCVSLLVIPRLPFSHPDALKERKRAEYPDLRSFIRAVVVPEMQIKLKQGFGRAIRTETDTCVIAILDGRSAPGRRHFEAMKVALPEMPVTDSLEDVVDFIYWVKGPDYFREGGNDRRKE